MAEKPLEIYKFRASFPTLGKEHWRDIEVLSTQTVEELACAVLTSFNCPTDNTWSIMVRNQEYVYDAQDPMQQTDSMHDPAVSLVGDLKIASGTTMEMEYGREGSGWMLFIRLAKKTKAKGDQQNVELDYPRLVNGSGNGFPQGVPEKDVFVLSMVQHGRTKKLNASEEQLERIAGYSWRWDDFDLEQEQKDFRERTLAMVSEYEAMEVAEKAYFMLEELSEELLQNPEILKQMEDPQGPQ